MLRTLVILFAITGLYATQAFSSQASSRSALSKQIVQDYRKALGDAQKHETAGLLRSAAAKSKMKKAQASTDSMKLTLGRIQEKLNQAATLIQAMEQEIKKVNLS